MYTTSAQHQWLVGNLVCRLQIHEGILESGHSIEELLAPTCPNCIALLKPSCLAFDTHFSAQEKHLAQDTFFEACNISKADVFDILYCIYNSIYIFDNSTEPGLPLSIVCFLSSVTKPPPPLFQAQRMAEWAAEPICCGTSTKLNRFVTCLTAPAGSCYRLFLWLPTFTVVRSRHTIWAPRLPKVDPQLLPGMGI